MTNRPGLRRYQAEAVDKLVSNGGGGLLFEVGLGKTYTVLSAVRCLGARAFPVLIVAPKAVALNTWPSELKKWTDFPAPGIAVGTLKQATNVIQGDWPVTIINFERLELLQKLGAIGRFKTVIIDESSKIKNSSAKRTKIILRFCHLWKYKFIMSGTPVSNGDLQEMWSQMYFLDCGQRLGKNLTAFRNRYCTMDIKYFGQRMVREWTVPRANEPEIKQLTAELCVSAMAKDHLTVESSVVPHALFLSGKAQAQYETLRDEAILALQDADDELFETGVMINRLTTFCSGGVYITADGERRVELVHTGKIDYLEELVNSIAGNVLVAYNYKFERELLRERWPAMRFFGEDDGDPVGLVDAWNAGQVKTAGIQPQRAGHGLNLQFGGHTIVWFSLPWSLEHYLQTNGRLLRQGQTHPVLIHHLLTHNTCEGYVGRKLRGKDQTNISLLEHLRHG